MLTSFSTALSALNAFSTGVDAIGNNLANLNTTGYKTNALAFRDLVSQSLGAVIGQTQIGFGVSRPYTQRQFNQGAIQATSGLLDAAVQGGGFFVVRDARGAQLFTRAGSFHLDAQGHLLTVTGERVQGWNAINGKLDFNTAPTNIMVPVEPLSAPVATSEVSLDINLDSRSVPSTEDPPASNFSAPVEIVDSMGRTHVLTINFFRTDTANEWTYQVTIPSASVGGAPTDPPVELVPRGDVLQFDSSGKLVAPEAPASINISLTGIPGASDMEIAWKLYDARQQPRVTQFAEASFLASSVQNGMPASQLVQVGLADGGLVMARYANGNQIVLGQLAMASIRNPDSMLAVGNSNFQTTANTAEPVIGRPETGNLGRVVGGALEASTADIAHEFTQLIVLQRGYQANTRVVTTADEISQETINLKR